MSGLLTACCCGGNACAFMPCDVSSLGVTVAPYTQFISDGCYPWSLGGWSSRQVTKQAGPSGFYTVPLVSDQGTVCQYTLSWDPVGSSNCGGTDNVAPGQQSQIVSASLIFIDAVNVQVSVGIYERTRRRYFLAIGCASAVGCTAIGPFLQSFPSVVAPISSLCNGNPIAVGPHTVQLV